MNRWSIYLLSNGSRTYVGSTTDPKRRLRQHNGEIRGGARATRGFKWRLVAVVSGFKNRSEACRWEKLIKSRARGLVPRFSRMWELVNLGTCPTGRKQYIVPTGLEIAYGREMRKKYVT